MLMNIYCYDSHKEWRIQWEAIEPCPLATKISFRHGENRKTWFAPLFKHYWAENICPLYEIPNTPLLTITNYLGLQFNTIYSRQLKFWTTSRFTETMGWNISSLFLIKIKRLILLCLFLDNVL